jgi:peptidoglycan hydrolase-like protein with peptidoglycan-binding domain
MSESQNENIEEPDALEHYVRSGDYQAELDAADDNGAAELEEAVRTLPQTEVILPVIMPKGDKLAALGDAVFDPETNKMVISFNTPAGRSVAELVGTGMLAAISFRGHMYKN